MPSAIKRWSPPRLKCAPTKERAHYVSAEWRAIRQRILIRDAYTCRSCEEVIYGPKAHVDHIRPLEEGGTDDPANLQILCESCHGRKSREEQRRRGLL
ncbi:MAG: HNH endonuclease [Planctomycetia bacterium]|nr:HNH endonuclease [Planctomycetia bacterium]